jgi:hypothetical protein
MNAKQAAAFLYGLTELPVLVKLVEYRETIEQIAELLEDLDTLQEHMQDMPDFEPEDSMDKDWKEKVQQCLRNVKSY